MVFRCELEVRFRCRSFIYKRLDGICMLSKESSETADKDTYLNREVEDVNYYERIPGAVVFCLGRLTKLRIAVFEILAGCSTTD